jgi:cell division protein FtsB
MKMQAFLARIFLLAEIVVFGYVYVWGVDGLCTYHEICAENASLEREIIGLKDELRSLEEQLDAWQSDPFYKEKVAREQLQMACVGEELFYIR